MLALALALQTCHFHASTYPHYEACIEHGKAQVELVDENPPKTKYDRIHPFYKDLFVYRMEIEKCKDRIWDEAKNVCPGFKTYLETR